MPTRNYWNGTQLFWYFFTFLVKIGSHFICLHLLSNCHMTCHMTTNSSWTNTNSSWTNMYSSWTNTKFMNQYVWFMNLMNILEFHEHSSWNVHGCGCPVHQVHEVHEQKWPFVVAWKFMNVLELLDEIWWMFKNYVHELFMNSLWKFMIIWPRIHLNSAVSY